VREIQKFILDWVMKTSGKRLSPSDDIFLVGGLDSLNFAELIAAIELEFTISIDFRDLYDWNSVKSARGLSAFAIQS
jgi:acyl carrier protein